MKTTPGGCYRIDGARVRRMEDPASPVGLTRWRERQSDLAKAADTIIHEHRRLTWEEIGLYDSMRGELQQVQAAIATLERDPAGEASSVTREQDQVGAASPVTLGP